MRYQWILFVICVGLTCCAFASQEGMLPLSTFSITSSGLNDSGPVTVSGKADSRNRIAELHIQAFDKKRSLNKDELNALKDSSYNGIQLSFETGYQSLGGRVIYIVFQRGFTSSVSQRIVISVPENGKIEIEVEQDKIDAD